MSRVRNLVDYQSQTADLDGDATRDLNISGTVTAGAVVSANVPDVNLTIAPEVLEIQVDAPDAGQNIMWKWTWEQSTLPYARRTITNSAELNVPLYKEGTYVVNNFAAYDIHGSMTQTHSLYLKWIKSAGTDNLVSWATSAGPISDTHPDINGGNATDVQRITVNVPGTITPPSLTNPSVAYTVTNTASGSYTFSGSASGDNPNLGPFYRGGTYTININATGHPFYFTTDNGTNFSAGTYFGEYTSGVTGSRTDSGTITFTVPAGAPDTLYYQCGNHGAMRGEITVKDLAVETNINGNYVVYFQHTQEGHATPVELRPIPSLVNQMCLVYDNNTNKFVPQDLATYVENTPSFENKIREVAGTAELVVEDGSAVIAKVNVYDDSTYLPLTGNNPGDQAFATDTDILYIWDGTAWQQAGAANSDDLTEGSTNLFFTDARVDSRLASGSIGNLVVGGNLTVNGTTTTINSTTLNVDDLNITLASGAASTSAADGAGITIDGAGAIFAWNNTQGSMTLNKELRLDNNKGLFFSNAAANATLGIKADASDNITFRQNGNWDRLVIKNTGVDVSGVLTPSGGVVIPGTVNDPPTIKLDMSGNLGQGDVTGKIEFYNADDTDNTPGAFGIIRGVAGPSGGEGSIQFLVDMPSEGTDADKIAIHVNGNGNVGINNITPPAKLSVGKTTNAYEDSIAITGINSATDIMAGIGFDQTIDTLIIRNDQSFAAGGIAFRPANGTDTKVFIRQDGNVGIGTTTPGEKLEVNGVLQIRHDGDHPALRFAEINSGITTTRGYIASGDWAVNGAADDDFGISGSITGDLLLATNAGAERLRIQNSTGNVGISTTNPLSTLDVNGVIRHSTEIVSDSVHKAYTIASNRGIDDYGGLNKEYWAMSVETPGAATTGESAHHAYGALKFSGVSTSDTTLDDVLVLRHNGNIGIGTNVPATKLHIVGGSDSIRVENTGTGNYGLEIFRNGLKGASIAWGEGNANLEFKNYRNDSQADGPYANIDFFTGGTNATNPNYNPDLRMRIQQTGEVGIGTSNPRSKLEVNGDGIIFRLDGSPNTSRTMFFRNTSTTNHAQIYSDGTLRLWTEDVNTSILLAPQNNSNYTIEHNANGFAPAVDNQIDLGRYDKGWKNVYTNDLQLSNMNSEEGNEVDGTNGKWTIQEGEEELFIINRLSGKKYAFMLREIE